MRNEQQKMFLGHHQAQLWKGVPDASESTPPVREKHFVQKVEKLQSSKVVHSTLVLQSFWVHCNKLQKLVDALGGQGR